MTPTMNRGVLMAATSVATNKALPKIRISQLLAAVAFTPDSFMYIGTTGGLLIPVRISTGKRGRAIRLRGVINTFAIAP